MTCFQVFFSLWKKKVNSRIRCRVCNRCTLLKHCGGGRGTDRPAERRDEEVWRADSSDRGGRWRHEKRKIWKLNVTFWKMKSDGKVLEMSSLMRSRLDSLSASDAPSTRKHTKRKEFNMLFEFGPERCKRSDRRRVVPLSLSLTELVSL